MHHAKLFMMSDHQLKSFEGRRPQR